MHHPLLAAVYDTVLYPMERLGTRKLRKRLVADLTGRIIEIGVGTGLNLPYYGRHATVFGVDADPSMLRRAETRATASPARTRFVVADAERLPFADGSFDEAVVAFTLCTVGDPSGALTELHRVLRSAGRFRFLEHVRSPQVGRARWQDRLAPAWASVAGGCRLNQDTAAIVADSKLEVVRMRHSSKGGIVSGEAKLG